MRAKQPSLEELIGRISGEPALGIPTDPALSRLDRHYIANDSWYARTAENAFAGWIFVSHCLADFAKVDQTIFKPITDIDNHVFLWNSGFLSKGKTQTHLPLVAHALRVIKTVVLCISRSSLQSDWVKAEAYWAVERQNPIIACKFDDTQPSEIHCKLNHMDLAVYEEVDFSQEEERGTNEVVSLIGTDRFRPGDWKGRGLGEIESESARSHLVNEDDPGRIFRMMRRYK